MTNHQLLAPPIAYFVACVFWTSDEDGNHSDTNKDGNRSDTDTDGRHSGREPLGNCQNDNWSGFLNKRNQRLTYRGNTTTHGHPSPTFSNSTPHLTHRGSTTAAQRPMDVSFAPLKHSLTPHLTYHGNTTTHGRSFRSSPNILNTPLDFPRQRNDPQTFLSPLSKHSPTQHPT